MIAESRYSVHLVSVILDSRELDVILQSVADGITVQDATGNLIYANEAAAALIGMPSAQAVLDVPPGALVERFEMWTEAGRPVAAGETPGRVALRTGRPHDALIRFRPRGVEGAERWSMVRARPVLDADGNATLVISVFHDETERRRRAEELAVLAEVGPRLGALEPARVLDELAALAVPRLGDACRSYAVDDQGRVVPAARVDAVSGAVLPEDADVAAALAGGRPTMIADALVVPLWARGRAIGGLALARAPGRPRYRPEDALLASRLADRAALLLDNARLYAAARRAVAVRDEFLAIAAHDLKSPLAAVLVSAAMARDFADDDRARRAARAILDAAGTMERLVHDLVDLGALEAGRLSIERQPCPAGELVHSTLALLEPTASERSVSLGMDCDRELRVDCDRARIQQVLTNLVANAVQFSPVGARVLVAVERVGGRARFAVVDQGAGIDPEALPHVFDRFWQARGGRGGVGLGLSIAQGLVAAHGAGLHVDSAPGLGSRFWFDLPIA
jgi:signal transduction histidine kinase